jgi:hypothetical protein
MMEDKNYLVVEVYPINGTRVVAQCEQIDDALLLLGQLVEKYDHPANLFGIRTIRVNGAESVSSYTKEEAYLPKDGDDND